MKFVEMLRRIFGSGPKVQLLKAERNAVVSSCYSVRGKNPATNRMKTVHLVVESTASIEEVQKKSGLLPPFEVKREEVHSGPTERQIAYAKKFGFAFPVDASSADASVFLTRAEEGRPLVQPPAPPHIIRYLTGKGIDIPAYAGIQEASAYYLHKISKHEKAAFFCMRVYCSHTQKRFLFLEDASDRERALFDEFAGLHCDDDEFFRSLSHYSASDIPLGSFPPMKKLKAYNVSLEFLCSKAGDS